MDDASGKERTVWLLHKVLINEFKQKRPRPGEEIGIKRLPDADKGYKRYRVMVDRHEPDVPDFEPGGSTPPGDSPDSESESTDPEITDEDIPF